jgi:hypothetical protein
MSFAYDRSVTYCPVYLYLTSLLFAGSYISRAKHLYSVPQASLVVNNSRIWASGITVQIQPYEM